MSTVKDIMEAIGHRLKVKEGVYPSLNRTIRMVSKRLYYHRSSMIKGELSVSVSADTSSGSMPDDFWGLMGKPYILDETVFLNPIPDQRMKLLYTDNTTPLYYELIDTTLYLYPGTSSAITIKGDYWKKPTKLTKPSDTIPFNELFDDVIEEALIHIYATGGSTGKTADVSLMENFINKNIDQIMPGIEQKIPTKIPVGINFNAMMRRR